MSRTAWQVAGGMLTGLVGGAIVRRYPEVGLLTWTAIGGATGLVIGTLIRFVRGLLERKAVKKR